MKNWRTRAQAAEQVGSAKTSRLENGKIHGPRVVGQELNALKLDAQHIDSFGTSASQIF